MESNLGTHLFLKAQGFMATNVLRDYHEDEDAYEFEYVLPDGFDRNTEWDDPSEVE